MNVKKNLRAMRNALLIIDTQIEYIERKRAELIAYRRSKTASELLDFATDEVKEAEEEAKITVETRFEDPVIVVVKKESDPRIKVPVQTLSTRVSSSQLVRDIYINDKEMSKMAFKYAKEAWNDFQISRGKNPGMDINGIPTVIEFKCKEFLNKGEALPVRNERNLSVIMYDDLGNIVWGKNKHIPVSCFDKGFYQFLVNNGINIWYRSENKQVQKVQSVLFML